MTTTDKPKKTLNGLQRTRYEGLKLKIKEGFQTAFEIGEALIEVRDGELYCEEFPTFKAFAASFEIGERYAYELVKAQETRKSLTPKTAELLSNAGQATALAKVPESKRETILAEVAAAGPVTAAKIKKAANIKPEPKPEPKEKSETIQLDKGGVAIPKGILADWEKADTLASEILKQLRAIKNRVNKGVEDQEDIFAEVHNTTVAALKNVIGDLERLEPGRVCPTCRGLNPGKCGLCKGRGWISEFLYKTAVPEETKKRGGKK